VDLASDIDIDGIVAICGTHLTNEMTSEEPCILLSLILLAITISLLWRARAILQRSGWPIHSEGRKQRCCAFTFVRRQIGQSRRSRSQWSGFSD
jgi:hypothetical protein